jgi:DNA-binding PadR family transcriptional regulator
MHKELHILGLLLSGPKTGYDLHRIVVAHGELFTDLKKGNVYYLLDRLAQRGELHVTVEAGARGPQRERYVYTLTEMGRLRFDRLLRDVVRTYEAPHTGIEVGMVFLPYLDPLDALRLLEERRLAVFARRATAASEAPAHTQLYDQLARDHLLCLMDAELAWVERALSRLREQQAVPDAAANGDAGCPGTRGSGRK